MLHQIGAGVLGPVFRAYQPAPGRLVAIKQFHLDLSPENAETFASGLQQIVDADLTQPGIAAPIAAGLADGTPYLAMDFVAAESFDVVIREYGPAHPKEALRLARQLGDALDAAAAVGVFHVGLHPRDVLMATDDVRLTGLGIAQVLESVGIPAPIRVPYSAPERVGRAAWDRRADTFSLAALIHEMLVGRTFAATDREGASLTSVDGADPERLRAVFATALAQNPRHRFASAKDFVDAMDRALSQPRKPSVTPPRRRTGGTQQGAPSLLADLELESEAQAAFHSEPDDAPHMSMLDAALPPLVSDAVPDEVRLDLRRSEPQPSDPDLGGVDTRLNAMPPAPPADLELGPIHVRRFEQLDDAAAHQEPVLRMDALDAAAEAALGAGTGASRDEPAPQVRPKTTTESRPLRLDALGATTDAAFAALAGRPSRTEFTHALDAKAIEEPTLSLDAIDAAAEASFARRAAAAPPEEIAISSTGRILSEPVEIEPAVRNERAEFSASSELAADIESSTPSYGGPFSRAAALGGSEGHSSTGNWSIVLGVALGLLVGFAFGYGFGLWRYTGAVLTTASSEKSEQSAAQSSPAQNSTSAQSSARSEQSSTPANGSQATTRVQGSGRGASSSQSSPASSPTRGSRGATPPSTPPAQRPPADGRLVLRTTPAGARVTIDGRDVGITPLTTSSLPPGQHVVGLAHQGYVGVERRVRIGSAQPAQSIDVELVARPAREIAASPAASARTSGSLTFESRPTGARVFVDEALVGTTPFQIDAITSGDHSVRFELNGFGPWSTTVKVVGGERTRVSGSLER